MNEVSPFSDPVLEPQRGLPGSINVLTILTFIGCGISVLSAVLGFSNSQKQYDATNEMLNSGKLDEAPAIVRNMINADTLELLRKAAENKVPLLIISLIGVGLCVYGAIQMRKLQKQGYYIWLMGEIIPIIGSVIFIGTGAFSGFSSLVLIFPVVFIILYATQLKYMK